MFLRVWVALKPADRAAVWRLFSGHADDGTIGDTEADGTAVFDVEIGPFHFDLEFAKPQGGFEVDDGGGLIGFGFGFVYGEEEDAAVFGTFGQVVDFFASDAVHGEPFGVGTALASIAVEQVVDL